jgi:hypothetical protein
MIDLIGNTPLIYIESLSKLTGCEIYVIYAKELEKKNNIYII